MWKYLKQSEGRWLLGTIIFIVTLWIALFSLLLFSEFDLQTAGQFGDTFGFLNTLFSGLAFIGIIAALIFQINELRQERIDRTLELFQVSRIEHMYKARSVARRARIKWFTSDEYRKKLLSNFFPKKVDDLTCLTRSEVAERRAILDLLEFYSLLAYHPGSDEIVRAFTFYFPSWRGFLRSFIEEYSKAYDAMNLSEDEQQQIPKRMWGKQIEKLEGRLGLPPYDQNKHFLDRILVHQGGAS
jgi:hypothetical protein